MLVTTARAAAPLALSKTQFKVIPDAQLGGLPCLLNITGSSDYQLRPFRVIATGYAQIVQSGKLALQLLAQASALYAPPLSLDPTTWTILGATQPTPIQTARQWMIQGVRLMFYLETGRMQGEFMGNIAGTPTTAVPITPLSGLLKHIDPLCSFAIAAQFVPDVPLQPTDPTPVVQLAHFQLGGEI